MRIKLWIGIVLALVLVLGIGSPVFAAPPPNGEEPEAEEVDVAVVGRAEVSVSVVGEAQVDMALVGDGAEIGVEIEGGEAQVGVNIGGDQTQVGVGIAGNASDVGIDIEGDQTAIGVDIAGEESTITINGLVPFVTYRTSGSRWARDQVKDVILPWMAETENTVALNADDLAGALLLAQSNETDLKAKDLLHQDYSDRLANLKSEVNSLDSESEDLAIRINAIEVESKVMRDYLEHQTAYYNYQVASLNQMSFYNRALMVIGALGAMAFGFWMRAIARRK